MFNLAFGVLALYFVTMVLQGKPMLVIVKDEENLETLVSSSIQAKKGANLLVSCRVMENEKVLDDQIVWSRRTPEAENVQTTQDGKLNFNHITEHDQGEYYCESPKYKLSRAFHLEVELDSSNCNENKRHARDLRPGKAVILDESTVRVEEVDVKLDDSVARVVEVDPEFLNTNTTATKADDTTARVEEVDSEFSDDETEQKTEDGESKNANLEHVVTEIREIFYLSGGLFVTLVATVILCAYRHYGKRRVYSVNNAPALPPRYVSAPAYDAAAYASAETLLLRPLRSSASTPLPAYSTLPCPEPASSSSDRMHNRMEEGEVCDGEAAV